MTITKPSCLSPSRPSTRLPKQRGDIYGTLAGTRGRIGAEVDRSSPSQFFLRATETNPDQVQGYNFITSQNSYNTERKRLVGVGSRTSARRRGLVATSSKLARPLFEDQWRTDGFQSEDDENICGFVVIIQRQKRRAANIVPICQVVRLTSSYWSFLAKQFKPAWPWLRGVHHVFTLWLTVGALLVATVLLLLYVYQSRRKASRAQR